MGLFLGIFQSAALFFVFGCAHVSSPNKKIALPQIEGSSPIAKSSPDASDRLKQMIDQSRGNPVMSRYLATDLFLKANMSLLDEDFLTASVLFKYLNDLEPNHDFIQKKYAISLIKMGDLETATPVLENLYKNNLDEKMGLILAGLYASLDQEKKAREIYQQILKKNGKNEDACVFLGKSYAIEKNSKRAISLLQKCAESNPSSGMYDFYIGKIHVDDGHMDLAIKSFEKAHKKQPLLSQPVSALGAIYEEREQFEKAILTYKRYLNKKENDEPILSRIIQVLFVKERYDEVIPYAERLSDIEPENLNLKVKLGILYTDAEKFPEALSIFKELLSHAPQSDKILYYIGAIYQEINEYQDAINYFNQIPSSSPLYSDSSIQMANMLSSLASGAEKWREIFLSHVNKSIENLADLRVEFSVIKSGFFESVGKYKEALESMMVVQNEKGFGNQHKYYLANLFEKEKKYAESTELIMGILEQEPKNAHAWNFIGYAFLMRGQDMDKAYEYIHKAFKLSPNDGYIRDSLGWYYYKTGNTKKALKELEYAFKQVPDDVEILKHLAEIHKELKNFNKARSFLESALKLARYPSDKSEILISLDKLNSDRLPASQKID